MKHPDIYQMLSYTTATGLDTRMLIYAKGEAEPVIHDIPMAGRSIEVRALDLSGAPDERMSSYWIRSWAREPPPSLPDAGAGTMSATTRVPSTYSWRTSASTPNLTHTTTGNNRFRHI